MWICITAEGVSVVIYSEVLVIFGTVDGEDNARNYSE
jgi:hypothetical protein